MQHTSQIGIAGLGQNIQPNNIVLKTIITSNKLWGIHIHIHDCIKRVSYKFININRISHLHHRELWKYMFYSTDLMDALTGTENSYMRMLSLVQVHYRLILRVFMGHLDLLQVYKDQSLSFQFTFVNTITQRRRNTRKITKFGTQPNCQILYCHAIQPIIQDDRRESYILHCHIVFLITQEPSKIGRPPPLLVTHCPLF